MLPNSPTLLVTDSDYAKFMRDNPESKENMFRELGLSDDEIAQIEALIEEELALEADTTTAVSAQGFHLDNEESNHG